MLPSSSQDFMGQTNQCNKQAQNPIKTLFEGAKQCRQHPAIAPSIIFFECSPSSIHTCHSTTLLGLPCLAKALVEVISPKSTGVFICPVTTVDASPVATTLASKAWVCAFGIKSTLSCLEKLGSANLIGFSLSHEWSWHLQRWLWVKSAHGELLL